MFKCILPMPTTLSKSEAVLEAANMLGGMGASQDFVFGSLARGELRPDSDIYMAVSDIVGGLSISWIWTTTPHRFAAIRP
jgi:hypothetical protein